MNRIATTFARLRAEGRVALMPYLTVGFPERESALELVPAMEAAGASMFELGVPFSDPLADGATIQRSAQRALANGITLADCITTTARLRERGVQAPLLLMGYYNPLLRYGLERACSELAAAGGDGWIIPDVPPEEAAELQVAAQAHGLDLIMFVAPTTPEARIAQIAARASGFIYVVSLTGVTGARQSMAANLDAVIARVRRASDLPLVVGFGISRPEHVAEVARIADGAIVGSALIAHLEQQSAEYAPAAAATFVRTLLSVV
ncbi:tryptophan synthase subunit alpha [Candidatus Viridilinea mediisalina]|uniref:Tryptophan synthase alpha chain n=1 Tax=Candidatus Viridilinea mediisalina TaxID=2024553 RepID=A0A2A6RH58_9CHLR|nr:tryptophan synthase subunit alpha [Candidatus Viridilinea mediisalina]PDW02190.1 tryptophan synthase subunit alpha [Candidatus Viridilinea mediisalina]